MKSNLNILYVEDSADDLALTRRTLKSEGIACTIRQVDNRDDFIKAIEDGGFDLILSDFSLPTFDGMSALGIASEKCPKVPFILLSGTLGEELAIEVLKSGATDYVLKDRLSRLAPSVRRALAEREERDNREHLEEQLRQSQKLEALGRLAGGIAHDFNNLLTAILGYSELLLFRLESGAPMRIEIEEIEKAGKRAATLTNQLLAFTRKQILQPRLVNTNDLVSNVQKLLRRLIGEDIDLVIRLDSADLNVQADPGQIEQVLMNLVVNSRDAMPSGGRLEIETSGVEVSGSSTGDRLDLADGSYVVIEVSDTGNGIEETIRTRIFEPFFTTKAPGEGTGLGLSMVYGIVKQSGGTVTVHSEPNSGTIFRVYLPRVFSRIGSDTAQERSEVMPKGKETILLAEDDSSVRTLAARVLKQQGYHVVEAQNGEEALRLVQSEVTHIDLVISDVVMPQMSGKALAEHLSRIKPGILVLLMSGYTGEFVSGQGEIDNDMSFLQKPFTPADLARTVRQILDNGNRLNGSDQKNALLHSD